MEYLEGIDTLETLRDTLRSPTTKSRTPTLKCCGRNDYGTQTICPFVAKVTKLCQDKSAKIPSFATFLGLKV